jgi:hypothetical protein
MKRAVILLWCWVAPLAAQTVLIKMGTVAPDGSPWHQILQHMGQQWQKVSGGKVTLRIYPGGVLGDEPDMITKMRIGQLQAVALSGSGLSRLEPAVACLQIPMMIESYEELDYVRDRVAPRLEKLLDEKGYVVLNWGDAGWVHFLHEDTRAPAGRHPQDEALHDGRGRRCARALPVRRFSSGAARHDGYDAGVADRTDRGLRRAAAAGHAQPVVRAGAPHA